METKDAWVSDNAVMLMIMRAVRPQPISSEFWRRNASPIQNEEKRE